MAAQVQPPQILRRRQVEARVGLSRSTIYAGIAAGLFPAPIKLGARAVGWLSTEVDAWLASRVEESRQQATLKASAEAA